MGWLSKIFKGSSHKISEEHCHENDGGDPNTDGPSCSGDIWPENENEDIDRAIALSLLEENQKGKNVIDFDSQLEEDEQLARALQESLNVDSPPRYGNGNTHPPQYGGNPHPPQYGNGNTYPPEYGNGNTHPPRYGNGNGNGNTLPPRYENGNAYPPRYGNGHTYPPIPMYYPMGSRICAGCNAEIGFGRYLNCLNAFWHPECFRCRACNVPISDYEFSTSGNYPYHKSCYKESYHPKCDVCKHFIPTNPAGLIEYRAHPFWVQKYCPSHEHDNTPRCCSCERMEARDTAYINLNDGRKLCLECLDSAIMDTSECQPLYLDIQEFYEGLNMKVEQQVPLLLVEREALNEAREGERNGHYHMPETRGLCLSEEQTISTISRRPKFGAGNRATDMITEPYKLTRLCEVTAILILYGLPRLLTGSILAHEMMHAWLRLKGYRLSQDVEEGICQVIAHMWLDAELMSGSEGNSASTSSSSSSSNSSKKGTRSQFEKKIGEFFKHQIEVDISPVYGDGYRAGQQAVNKYGLRRTLDHIQMTGTFPY
ncbi:putative transcription factor interactor and regulator LIM family [Rosa chinensis]|uniref:Putative transcription factor interactor and regulator LIM family n=2 Tax=Rosa chinensis TaxID=74649 RepID=A0A2P6PYH6_ROSCH|nr:protein DA1 isoform X2 [Rosa chinensis]XP_040364015.1 protein DA1 isoform X2 [Rosa chinensis]PRQ26972.1 putative transcription factor interactor and regulator LIM family [Rosa chinensis]